MPAKTVPQGELLHLVAIRGINNLAGGPRRDDVGSPDVIAVKEIGEVTCPAHQDGTVVRYEGACGGVVRIRVRPLHDVKCEFR